MYSAQQRLWQAFPRWFGIVLLKSTSTQITLGAVAHLAVLCVEVLHLDPELVERTRGEADQNLLPVFWVSFLRRIRQHPVLPFLAVSPWTQRDRPGELVGNVVPFVVSKPRVMTPRTRVLWVDIVFFSHIRIMWS